MKKRLLLLAALLMHTTHSCAWNPFKGGILHSDAGKKFVQKQTRHAKTTAHHVKKKTHAGILMSKVSNHYQKKLDKLSKKAKQRIKSSTSGRKLEELLNNTALMKGLESFDDIAQINDQRAAALRKHEISQLLNNREDLNLTKPQIAVLFSLEVLYHTPVFKKDPLKILPFLKYSSYYNRMAMQVLHEIATHGTAPLVIKQKDKEKAVQLIEARKFLRLPSQTVQKLKTV